VKYDQLSNTLTFTMEGGDPPNLLLRLEATLKDAYARGMVDSFIVRTPNPTKILKRKRIMFIFNRASLADHALKWILNNFIL